MADSVEVRPRFHEPDAPATPAAVPQPIINPPVDATQVAAPAVPAAKGLFTSMYENKIIVLIIVVVIVIIGIIAYVIFRKPEEEPDKPKSPPKNGGGNQGDGAAAQNNNATQPTQPAQTNNTPPENPATQAEQTNNPNPPPKAPAATQAPKPQNGKMDRSNIMNLLERSKNNSAKPAPVSTPQNVKSEDEIMQLMEDEEEPNSEEPDENANDHEEPEIPSILEPSPAVVNSNAQGNTYCNFVLPTKRTCRNKVKSNGKCHLHGG